MHSEVGNRLAAVAAELVAARKDAGVSQPKLAERAKVHRNTISDIERMESMPSADMLRRLADGLATYSPGRTDPELADAYYQRLMVAAGYLENPEAQPASEPERRRPVEDLTDDEVADALTRISQDPQLSAEFLSVAEDWADMSPSAQRFILNSFQLARQVDEEVKAAGRDQARPRSRARS